MNRQHNRLVLDIAQVLIWACAMLLPAVFTWLISGDSNRFAYACCISVATAPMETYNPLFIYGGSGLGKTHLMCAIGHYVEEKFPDKRVVYVSGENFTYHYVKSLREHKIDEFRRSYRNIDVFLVDDI